VKKGPSPKKKRMTSLITRTTLPKAEMAGENDELWMESSLLVILSSEKLCILMILDICMNRVDG